MPVLHKPWVNHVPPEVYDEVQMPDDDKDFYPSILRLASFILHVLDFVVATFLESPTGSFLKAPPRTFL